MAAVMGLKLGKVLTLLLENLSTIGLKMVLMFERGLETMLMFERGLETMLMFERGLETMLLSEIGSKMHWT
jgi:hypothetical protein